jgi:hypothetical protein
MVQAPVQTPEGGCGVSPRARQEPQQPSELWKTQSLSVSHAPRPTDASAHAPWWATATPAQAASQGLP